jgi:hypothetical protein
MGRDLASVWTNPAGSAIGSAALTANANDATVMKRAACLRAAVMG